VGGFLWDGSGAGKLTAQFQEMAPAGARWASEDGARRSAQGVAGARHRGRRFFEVGVHRFGRLDVQAHNDGGIWRLDRIELLNPYGSLSGSGQWQISNGNRTQLDFTLDSSDVGKLLDRLGYGGAYAAAARP
jgi:hypothetical protein